MHHIWQSTQNYGQKFKQNLREDCSKRTKIAITACKLPKINRGCMPSYPLRAFLVSQSASVNSAEKNKNAKIMVPSLLKFLATPLLQQFEIMLFSSYRLSSFLLMILKKAVTEKSCLSQKLFMTHSSVDNSVKMRMPRKASATNSFSQSCLKESVRPQLFSKLL